MTHYSNTRNPIDFPKKKDIPFLEKFAAQSLVEHDGELIFSKERFAELIVKRIIENIECHADMYDTPDTRFICEKIVNSVKFDFGVEE